jgi:hypothetical protein
LPLLRLPVRLPAVVRLFALLRPGLLSLRLRWVRARLLNGTRLRRSFVWRRWIGASGSARRSFRRRLLRRRAFVLKHELKG